jgi:hypothetical protein
MTPEPARRAAALAVAMLFAAAAAGQDPPAPAPVGPFPADGTELFRGLFVVEGIGAVGSAEAAEVADPRGLILVLNGRPMADLRFVDLAVRMVQTGGAVVVLAEEAADLSRFVPSTDTRLSVTGRKAYCGDPARCLDGNGWMPFPDPYIGKGGFGAEAALIDGLTRIATNVPSHLVVRRRLGPGDIRGLAIFPDPATRSGGPGGFPLARRSFEAAGGGGGMVDDDRLFAVAASGPRESNGKLLVLSDPSIFVNEMMARGATGAVDNLTFAVRVVRWLKTTDHGVRGRCLFVDHGAVLGSFAEAGFSPRPAPAPAPVPVLDPLSPKFQSALADAGDKAVERLENNGWFDKVLTGGAGDDRRFAGVLRALAGLAAAAGAWWVVTRVRAARLGDDTPAPPRGSGTTTAVGSLAQRQADLLKSGDVAGPVREVVAGLFAAQGLTGPASGPAPAIETSGPDADGLARRVRELWDRVLGPAGTPVTAARWKELEPMLDEVYRAADAGRWRVAPQGGSA